MGHTVQVTLWNGLKGFQDIKLPTMHCTFLVLACLKVMTQIERFQAYSYECYEHMVEWSVRDCIVACYTTQKIIL